MIRNVIAEISVVQFTKTRRSHNHGNGRPFMSAFHDVLEQIEEQIQVEPVSVFTKLVKFDSVAWFANRVTEGLLFRRPYPGFQGPIAYGRYAHLGLERSWELEEGQNGQLFTRNDGRSWMAFSNEDVKSLRWVSSKSHCVVTATKVTDDLWEMEFIPTKHNPEYRGRYYTLWADAQA